MSSSPDARFEHWRRTGDAQALAEVFDEIAPRLLRLAYHLSRDPAAAEDLVQSTFLAAIESAATWDASRPLERWLTGILDHRAKELHRARRRPLEEVAREDVDHETPVGHAIEQEHAQAVARAIDQLEEPYRSVLVLGVLHHMDPAAIAHALDRSPGAVRVQLHRGREALRKLLPAGVLTGAALALTSARGLAAVKSAVLSHAASQPVVAATGLVGGAILMKKTLLVVLALVLVVVGAEITIGSVKRSPADKTDEVVVLDGGSRTMRGEPGLADDADRDPAREPAVAPMEELLVTGLVTNRSVAGGAEILRPAAGLAVRVTLVPYGDTSAPPPPSLSSIGYASGAKPPRNAAGRADDGTHAQVARTFEGAATTGDDGRFRVRVRKPRGTPVDISVECSADEEFCADRRRSDVSGDKASLDGIALVRFPRGTIHGRTIDAHDAPLAGVRVRAIYGREETEALEAVSDENGLFALRPQFHRTCELTAELEGWSTYEDAQMTADDAGKFPEATLVLAPVGRLVVRVSDVHGAPVADARVHVQAAGEEPRRTRARPMYFRGSGFQAKTDAEGIASFGELWQGKRLTVHIGDWLHGTTFVATSGGRLLPPDEAGGEPIVIGPGGSLELAAQQHAEVRIRGRVVLESGAPVADAVLEVREAEVPYHAAEQILVSGKADAGGSFDLRVPIRAATGALRVAAFDREWFDPRLFGDPSPPSGGGSLIVDPRGPEAEHGIEIVVRPLSSISGQVVFPQGVRGRGELVAVPAGSTSPLEQGPLGRPASAQFAADGAFRVQGLPSGAYDLHVRTWDTGFYTFELGTQVFPGISAGSEGVSLQLHAFDPVRVHVRAVSRYGEVGKITVLRGRRVERVPTRPTEADRLGAARVVRTFVGWPSGAPLDIRGVAGETTRTYQDQFGLNAIQGSEAEVPAMGEGWGVIGLVATLADGRACFPQATGLVWLAPGDHEITFEAVPIARLEGRVHGGARSGSLEIALADDDGALMPVRGYGLSARGLLTSVALRDDGWFLFDGAPLGRHRIRIGAREELEAGRFLLEREILVQDGMPALEIDLHD